MYVHVTAMAVNQYKISTPEGTYFQSYNVLIAKIPSDRREIILDSRYWNYSVTTGKYRNQFLGEGIAETRKKIKSGEYILADLN